MSACNLVVDAQNISLSKQLSDRHKKDTDRFLLLHPLGLTKQTQHAGCKRKVQFILIMFILIVLSTKTPINYKHISIMSSKAVQFPSFVKQVTLF